LHPQSLAATVTFSNGDFWLFGATEKSFLDLRRNAESSNTYMSLKAATDDSTKKTREDRIHQIIIDNYGSVQTDLIHRLAWRLQSQLLSFIRKFNACPNLNLLHYAFSYFANAACSLTNKEDKLVIFHSCFLSSNPNCLAVFAKAEDDAAAADELLLFEFPSNEVHSASAATEQQRRRARYEIPKTSSSSFVGAEQVVTFW
jgi:hypothetical protein